MPQYIHNYTNRQCEFVNQVNSIIGEKLEKITAASLMDILPYVFFKLFGKYPHKIEPDYDGVYLNTECEEAKEKKNRFDCTKNDYFIPETAEGILEFDNDDDDISKYYTFKQEDILEQFSAYNLITNYKGNELCIFRYEEDAIIIMGDDIKSIWYKANASLYLYSYTEYIHPYILEHIVTSSDDEENRYFDYVVYNQHGFNTTELPIKRQNINIEDNYNEDLPHEQIKEFISNADAGLCILHGKPGTGKTTYIRHLMRECKDTNFMVLNTSCFDMIADSSFVNLIVNNQGSVVILEDCEDMLAERSGNSRIATLLNLSDGILGDALRLKFICTFNASIGKIDPAILRKGRTHIKYEFKELTKDKAEILANKIGVQLPEKKGNQGFTLAEIYNAANELVSDSTTKVGFSKS